MNAPRALTIAAVFATHGVVAALVAQTPPAKAPATLGIGRLATAEDIAKWDIDVQPDGTGLPAGGATSADGAPLYAARCSPCHGKSGREGPNDRLAGRVPGDAFPFAREPQVRHTIGNYWPYATTVFDYIRRAMPPDAPGSLKDNEVYGLTAYLLFLNDLISVDFVVDAASLPNVKMPARDRFVPDPRGGPKPTTTKPAAHKGAKGGASQ